MGKDKESKGKDEERGEVVHRTGGADKGNNGIGRRGKEVKM
jgi:hypothetical protein